MDFRKTGYLGDGPDWAPYYLDHYGRCRAVECRCLLTGRWFGQRCPNWRPKGAKSYDDLKKALAKDRDPR